MSATRSDPEAAPERRRLELPDRGVELSVLDWGGDGPLALLHHATGFAAALWAPVAERLREDFHVVAIDARGHGDSTKPEDEAAYHWENFGLDLVAVARIVTAAAGRETVALGLGHSFGGTACLTAAASAPGLFERLVLLDPVIRPSALLSPEGAKMKGGSMLADTARKRRPVWPDRAAALAKWRTKQLFADFEPRSLELYVNECLRDRPDGRVELKCPREVEATVFAAGAFFDPWPFIERVDAATLILWAEHGNFPRALHQAVANTLREGECRSFPAGHLMVMEQPERVAKVVAEFARAGRPVT